MTWRAMHADIDHWLSVGVKDMNTVICQGYRDTGFCPKARAGAVWRELAQHSQTPLSNKRQSIGDSHLQSNLPASRCWTLLRQL